MRSAVRIKAGIKRHDRTRNLVTETTGIITSTATSLIETGPRLTRHQELFASTDQ
jgi:hypothetical protein